MNLYPLSKSKRRNMTFEVNQQNINPELITLTFEDATLKHVLSDFLYTICNDKRCSLTSNYETKRKSKQIISALFLTITLAEITSEWLLDKSNIVHKYDLKYLIRILLFLMKAQVVPSSDLYRLLYFEDRFNRQTTQNDIIYILSISQFDDYLNAGLLDSISGLKIFFLFPKKDDYHYSETYSFVVDFFDFLKLSTSNTFESLYNELLYTKKMTQECLQSIRICQFDLYYLRNYISKNNTNILPSALMKMLYFALNYGYLNSDSYFSSIEHLEYNLCLCPKKSTLIEIFSSESPEKYHFIQTSHQTYLHYIDSPTPAINNILIGFLSEYQTTNLTQKKLFSHKFNSSLYNVTITNVYGFNYHTFIEQFSYFKKLDKKCLGIIVSFYLYIHREYNHNLFNDSSKFHVDVLQRHTIVNELLEGFQFVWYSPLEDVPLFDKWLFYYPNQGGSNLSINSNSSISIDFSKIQCVEYRKLAKFYFWHKNIAVYSRNKEVKRFQKFANYIYDLKTGKQLSYFSKKSISTTINSKDIVAFKNHITSSYQNHVTISKYIYSTRNILKFAHDHHLNELDNASLYHLTYSAYHRSNSAKSISNTDLEKLAAVMRLNAQSSLLHDIYYVILYILLETEFRISQILALNKDCIEDTYKSNQYILKSITKSSPTDKQEQPITIYVKRQLEQIEKNTRVYRQNCNRKNIKNYLFLVPSQRKNMYKMITCEDFNKYLKKCCSDLKIPKVTASNLRDTHMTKSEEYAIRNSISDIELTVLTGHRSYDTTSNHYIDTSITDLLESVHGIIIGNLDVEGLVITIPPAQLNDTDSVSNKCGYCSSDTCNDFTYLDCMLCSNFVTCLDRIPYFKEQLRIIEEKILVANLQHDIEDLQSIKILLAKYLSKLLILKKETTNG